MAHRRARWLGGVAAILVVAAAAGSCAQGTAPAHTQTEDRPAKKRGTPPVAAPVTASGVRYEAVVWGRRRGLDQNGGYVTANDVKTGRELWLAKVYAPPHDPEMEADKQDLFIARLRIVDGGRALLVTDERGGRYPLDLASRVVPRP